MGISVRFQVLVFLPLKVTSAVVPPLIEAVPVTLSPGAGLALSTVSVSCAAATGHGNDGVRIIALEYLLMKASH